MRSADRSGASIRSLTVRYHMPVPESQDDLYFTLATGPQSFSGTPCASSTDLERMLLPHEMVCFEDASGRTMYTANRFLQRFQHV
jgi:hypothetical protein